MAWSVGKQGGGVRDNKGVGWSELTPTKHLERPVLDLRGSALISTKLLGSSLSHLTVMDSTA